MTVGSMNTDKLMKADSGAIILGKSKSSINLDLCALEETEPMVLHAEALVCKQKIQGLKNSHPAYYDFYSSLLDESKIYKGIRFSRGANKSLGLIKKTKYSVVSPRVHKIK